ncbi:MAG: UvrD-helicase domain-containing protein [Candidatus Saganbacteria bacterium]|nr:UvrD-helicase domain-containing protein [Candidatus Saganbacteria bacterium]
MAILKSLNERQKEAVLCTESPVLIIAGAGSGKTRVLTHRIAYLVKGKNISPHRIMAVTFTNKAANEMKHRLKHLVGILAKDMWVGTFHSICGRILRRDIEKLGREKNYVIFDENDQKILMKQVLKEADLDEKRYKPAAMLESISKAKNDLVNDAQYMARASDIWQEKVSICYRLYQEKLNKNNALDFDDMLMYAVELLEKHESVRKYYQERFLYINVDEYQDTNRAQYMITKLLAGGHKNICVVGDDDQSIYGFRGADIANILDFEKDYKDAKVFKLEENYRSTQNILDAANAVIAKNAMRKPKTLWTKNAKGDAVAGYLAKDEKDEALFIADNARRFAKGDFSRIAVLYRTNAQSRVIEEAFLQSGIPYRMIGGFRFYERKEIKDILSLLKMIYNPSDNINCLRVLSFMLEGVGKVTISKIENEANARKIPLAEMIEKCDVLQISRNAKQQLAALDKKIKVFRDLSAEQPASQLIAKIYEDTDMIKDIEEEQTAEALSRAENLREFLTVALDFEDISDDPSLGAFLTQMSLVTDQDTADGDKPSVLMMTLHSAKGLEFPIVFIAGMEEGIFPHYRAMFEPKELEEERRLCYVGITRAKEKLFLCHAQERMLFGESWCNGPSRFLEEIPAVLFDEKSWMDLEPGEKQVKIRVSSDIYSVGDAVNHPKWGTGEVIKIDGDGEDTVIDVVFSNFGTKSLMLKYAPVNRLQAP